MSYPTGFAVMADLKRDMAILGTGGRDSADRTKRPATRVLCLDIFSQGLIAHESGGCKITAKGRAVLDSMERRPRTEAAVERVPIEKVDAAVSPPSQPLSGPSGDANVASVGAGPVSGCGRTLP